MTRMPRRLSLLSGIAALGCTLALGACAGHKRAPLLVATSATDDAGSAGDAGSKTTTATPDAGKHAIASDGTALCIYNDDDRFVVEEQARPLVLRAAASHAGFGLVFQRSDGALFVQAVPLQGAAAAPVAVAAASEQATAPALVASETSFLLGYRASDTLVVRGLMADASAPLTLASSLAPTDLGEPWALGAGPNGFLASWVDAAGGGIRLQSLDDSGAASGVPQLVALAQRKPRQLALAQLSTGESFLAWREADASGNQAVFGQKLGISLAAAGIPTQLSNNSVAPGAFQLAGRFDSVGLLYPALDGGVREALKLRRIDASGAPDGPVLNVANAPRVVNAGSIAAFGRGYALVYRELPSLGRAQGAVRIAFVNQFGSVVYDAELSALDDASAGTTSVATNGSDALIVSWTEAGQPGARVHAIRMACPGALVLCGGPAG